MKKHTAVALSVVAIAAASGLAVALTGTPYALWGMAFIFLLKDLFSEDD